MVFIGVIMLFTADGFMAAARAEMPYYYKHHPQGRWGNYLFALTNVGPNSPP